MDVALALKASWRRRASPDHAMPVPSAPCCSHSSSHGLLHSYCLHSVLTSESCSPSDVPIILFYPGCGGICPLRTTRRGCRVPDEIGGGKHIKHLQVRCPVGPHASFDRQNIATPTCIKTQFFPGTRMTLVQRLTPETPPQEAT